MKLVIMPAAPAATQSEARLVQKRGDDVKAISFFKFYRSMAVVVAIADLFVLVLIMRRGHSCRRTSLLITDY